MKVTEVYAFVGSHKEGEDEGICATNIGKMVMPLITADPDLVMMMEPFAQRASNESGRPIKLIKFSMRTEVREVVPVKAREEPPAPAPSNYVPLH